MKQKALNILNDYSCPDYMRWLSIMDLRKEKGKDIITSLIDSLNNDPNSIIRHDAAFLLGIFGKEDESAITSIMNKAINDSSFVVRHEAVEILGYIQLTNKIKEVLLKAKKDPNTDVSMTAQLMLDVHMNTDSTIEKSYFLDYSQPTYKRWIAGYKLFDSLKKKRTLSEIKNLITCLQQDPNPILRHMGAFLLAEIRGREAIHALVYSATRDYSPLVRHESIETLGFFRLSPNSKAVIKFLLNDAVKDVRDTAKLVLELHENSKRLLTV